jgi:hypothetical protein
MSRPLRRNKVKKIVLLIMFLLLGFNTICFAAISGSKSAPAPRMPAAQTAPAPAPASGYKPSAPANSYSDTAPKAALPQTSQPATGGFMRNMGMLGGGMLLGGLLGGMFGGNSGMFASLAGLVLNVILLVGIFMAGRYVWDRFKKSREENNRRN